MTSGVMDVAVTPTQATCLDRQPDSRTLLRRVLGRVFAPRSLPTPKHNDSCAPAPRQNLQPGVPPPSSHQACHPFRYGTSRKQRSRIPTSDDCELESYSSRASSAEVHKVRLWRGPRIGRRSEPLSAAP